ncbi:MAG TPA: hypothetical protein PLI45_00100 [Candidatus Woesebacteria bacterium]|nr:hypothetical protein [Candidatus Woesebacteria bacterium]
MNTKRIIVILVLVAICLSLCACSSENDQKNPELTEVISYRSIPISFTYSIDPDVSQITGRNDYALPDSNTIDAHLVTNGYSTWISLNDLSGYPDETYRSQFSSGVELLSIRWSQNPDVSSNYSNEQTCMHYLVGDRLYLVEQVDGVYTFPSYPFEDAPYGKNCFDNLEDFQVTYIAAPEYCKTINGSDSIWCSLDNLSLSLDDQVFSFTISGDSVTTEYREMLVNLLKFKGIDPLLLLPQEIRPNSNYMIEIH